MKFKTQKLTFCLPWCSLVLFTGFGHSSGTSSPIILTLFSIQFSSRSSSSSSCENTAVQHQHHELPIDLVYCIKSLVKTRPLYLHLYVFLRGCSLHQHFNMYLMLKLYPSSHCGNELKVEWRVSAVTPCRIIDSQNEMKEEEVVISPIPSTTDLRESIVIIFH